MTPEQIENGKDDAILASRLEAEIRHATAEAKSDAELAELVAFSLLALIAEGMGGRALVALLDGARATLAEIPRGSPPPRAEPRWCRRAMACGRMATWERWDGDQGDWIPVCDLHAKGAEEMWIRRPTSKPGATP